MSTPILQFGTGRFLRGFFDCIIPESDSITAVQSRPGSGGADLINRNLNGYHVWTRGKQQGQVIDEFEHFESLAQAIDANVDWPAVLTTGTSADLRLIVSNTTEAGLTLDPSDNNAIDIETRCPTSYPAKLLNLLFLRYRAGLNGVTILPLELVEYNANQLKSLVKQQASFSSETATASFLNWLETENRWLNNLVDRIVVGVTEPSPWDHDDPLAVVAEPFRMLAIEDDESSRDILPDHPMISWVPNLQPLFIRKVRILNGLHTAMVAHSLPQGFETVLDVMNDAGERAWLEGLLHNEILPALSSRGIQEAEFANAVLERFENPFFQHRLADIAKGHATKLTTRIQPTIDDYRAAFDDDPAQLHAVMTASLKAS